MELRGWRYGLCLGAAPLVLVAVATLQIVRVHLYDQNPWRGGGFGMFGNADSPDTRYVRVFLVTEHGEVPASVPRCQELCDARIVPTRDNLDRLAEHLLRSARWVEVEGKTASPHAGTEPPAPNERMLDPVAIRVEYWRYTHDVATNRLRGAKYLETVKPVSRRKET